MKYLQPRKQYIAAQRLLEEIASTPITPAPIPSPTTDKLKAMLSEKYPQFVKELQGMESDPKLLAVIKAGMYDGDKDDERITFPEQSTAHYVRDLIPMQNEVDIDSSLRFQLSTTPENKFGLDRVLTGEPVTIIAPLIILNGKYIMDGHHRWSQTYALNKDGQIVCFNFKTRDANIDPTQVLKAIQMAIVACTKEVAVAEVHGKNLLKAPEQVIIDYVTEGTGSINPAFKGASEESVRVVGEAHSEVVDKQSLAEYIWTNVHEMQTKNQPYGGSAAPERGLMPQTDGVIDSPQFKDLLNKGAINFLEPVARQKAKPEPVAA